MASNWQARVTDTGVTATSVINHCKFVGAVSYRYMTTNGELDDRFD